MDETVRPHTPRTGVFGSLLVALGVAASVLPLRDLFEGRPWGPAIIAMLAVVALTGVVSRWFGLPGWAVPLVQGGFLVGLLTAMFGGGTGILGLVPTTDTFAVWRELLFDARESIASSAPPAPSTVGVVFTVAAACGAVALVTDAIGVTGGQPALAGLPMVVPFLVSVANSTGGLPVFYMVLVAACWLALMAVVDDSRITLLTRGGRDRGASAAAAAARTGRMSSAAVIGAAAIVVALALAAALPITPNTMLADRLGLSGGAGRVGFSPSPDMLSDLDDSNPSSVLRYTSDDPAAPPLRVAVSTRYTDGTWEARQVRERVSSAPTLARPPGLSDGIDSEDRRISVTENRLAAPHLAAPELVKQGTVTGATWAMDPNTGVLAAGAMPPAYELTYLTLRPTPDQLRASPSGRVVIDDVDPVLDTSGISSNTARIAAQVTDDAATPYDRAVALQNWFRSEGGFTYSLDLAPVPAGMSDRQAAITSVDRFLESKQGYCVQFSTAMTLMARSVGIPARLATGFLPGRVEGDARRVLSTDAHAWPELYFEGIGWLRFEPTPSVQSGPAPDYAPDTADQPTPTPTQTPTPTPIPTITPQQPTPTAAAPEEAPADAAGAGFPWQAVLLALAVVVAIALLVWLFTLPARVAARDRRDRLAGAATPAEGVLAVWDGFVSRLGDLGVRLDSARVLPRQAEDLATDLDLGPDDRRRLERLASAVENARYAPVLVGAGARSASDSQPQRRADLAEARRAAGSEAPMTNDPVVAQALADARALSASAEAGRPRGQRLAARAFPASGRAGLRRRVGAMAADARAAVGAWRN